VRLTGGMVCRKGRMRRIGKRERRVMAARVENVVDVAARSQMRTKVATGQLYFLAQLKKARYFLLVSCCRITA
jgi:hypothetical protein